MGRIASLTLAFDLLRINRCCRLSVMAHPKGMVRMRTRARLGRLPLVSGLIALSIVTVGLVGPVAAATPTAASPSSALDGSLVGTWERVTRCKELVHALEKAGLDEFVLDNVVGNGFLPGVTSPDQIADPKHPCKGAVPRVHAHFFTADGQFGSLDFTGQQVDAGIYTIIEPGTVVIDNGDFRATFHYRFTDHGDTIRLYPIAPDCVCVTAQWAVAVAYPGKKWTRMG
jgi:hypothetical protein